jgi:FAD/FMN-containing dehydrogenase/Fe-S oxidoreductase
MNPEQARIQADLRGLIDGDVFCDDLFRQMYSTDGSILQICPAGVVRPRSVKDVAAVVRYAAENQLPVHPRGAGSNVVGGAIGPGLVLDFSVHMRRAMMEPGDLVRVQPGAVLANVNRYLARMGRMFGPDPPTRSVTTMGGVLALNAIGSHWRKYGSPHEKISRLQVVLADGTIAEVGPTASPDLQPRRLSDQIELLLGRRRVLVADHQPETPVNHAGYNLTDLITDGRLDLARLIAGSEGTLAIITEAVLETQAVPEHRGVVLLFFDQMQTAVRTGLEALEHDPAACDLVDRRLLSLIRTFDDRYQRVIPEGAEAMLLIELQAEDASDLRSRIQSLEDRFTRRRQAFHSRSTCSLEERNFYWRMVRRGIPMQFGMRGPRQAIPFVEDLCVAPANLPEFLYDLPGYLNACELTATVFANVGNGVLHIRPQVDLTRAEDISRMRQLSDQLVERVLGLKGTVSGSHGDGLVRTPWLRRQYGPMYEVLAEIKREFDPGNVLNPGKIVDQPRIDPLLHLRQFFPAESALARTAAPPETQTETEPATEPAGAETNGQGKRNGRRRGNDRLKIIEPQLTWELPELSAMAAQCNGCGRCRTSSPDERMCPIFRLNPLEEASPRAKANLMRNFLNGNFNPAELNSEELKDIADLCVNCHQCRLECPAGVDIPGLMVEAKAQHVAVNGLRMSEWLLTRLDVLYRYAGRMPRLANWMIRNRVMRWILDRLFGIAQARKLPRFAGRSFLKVAARHRWTQAKHRDVRKVLYFVDAYANWNDVELAMATCAVLRHNGFEIYVPPNQQISGMSMISAGVIDRARKIAARNVELLAEGVRQGCQIVTAEPSAALALKHEYLRLLDDPDARMVSENCSDISNFLWALHLNGKLELNFRPLNATVGYHLPCHQRALSPVVAGMNLLGLIPGLKVERIEKGCSGMAGMYGLIRPNYRRSLRAGVGLIGAVRQPHIMAGTTECSTCKIQMEQGTIKPTIHPVKILALAYGLMPELDTLFERRSEPLVVT